jgi:hypothetical protein
MHIGSTTVRVFRCRTQVRERALKATVTTVIRRQMCAASRGRLLRRRCKKALSESSIQ